MDPELYNTLKLIMERTGQSHSVFIPINDFPWSNRKDGQLTRLMNQGMILKPRFYDDGAEIILTSKGRSYLLTANDTGSTTKELSIFVSYKHKKNNSFVSDLETKLEPYANVIIDKNSVDNWGSFKQFMDSIRDQDFAVLVISNDYLRSSACMYEVLQFMKEKNWNDRVMYIVEDDTQDIFTPTGRIQYLAYWKEKDDLLTKEIKKIDPAYTIELAG